MTEPDDEEWEFDGDCSVCHTTMLWEGDPPTCAEEAMCHSCVAKERDKLKTAVKEWRANYYKLVDAIGCRESSSVEHAESTARSTRDDLEVHKTVVVEQKKAIKVLRDAVTLVAGECSERRFVTVANKHLALSDGIIKELVLKVTEGG